MLTAAPIGKLAVLLHADVAGSTELVQRDERLAHRLITDAFRNLARIVRDYGGRVHEIRGDALVAEFTRPSDAVGASLAFQLWNAKGDDAVDSASRPHVRIGIALGEVVIDGGTVTGEGIVLAQRVEQHAFADGICVTEAIREALPTRLPVESENLGKQELKGFPRAIRIYRLGLASGARCPTPERRSNRRRIAFAAATLTLIVLALIGHRQLSLSSEAERTPPARADTSTSGKISLAILPFDNRSGETDQDYFVDGITEDLITDLAKVRDLLVVSAPVAFRYKGLRPDLQELRDDLRVSYVLSGTVRRFNGQLRITAQLTDAESGFQLWADRFDRDLDNLFTIQEELTTQIASALELTLTESEKNLVAWRPDVSIEAYDGLLKARTAARRWQPQANEKARQVLHSVIERYPSYADAHAEMSWILFQQWALEGSTRSQLLDLALDAAGKAVEFAPSLPRGHAMLGWIYLWRKEHDRAVAAMNRALEIDPNYAEGYARLSETLMFAGRPAEALKAIEAARSRTAVEYYAYGFWAGEALYYLGQLEAAARELEHSIALNPGFFASRRFLAAIYVELGRDEEAQREIRKALEINPGISIDLLRRQLPFRHEANLERQLRALRRAGLPES